MDHTFANRIKNTVENRCKGLTRVIFENDNIDALKILIERDEKGGINIILVSYGIRDDRDTPFYKHNFGFKLNKQKKNVNEKSKLNLLRGKKKQQHINPKPEIDVAIQKLNNNNNNKIEQTIVQEIPNDTNDTNCSNGIVLDKPNITNIKLNNMKILNINKIKKQTTKTIKTPKKNIKTKNIKNKTKCSRSICIDLEAKYNNLVNSVSNCYTCSRGIATVDDFYDHNLKLYKEKKEKEKKIRDLDINKKYTYVVDPATKVLCHTLNKYATNYEIMISTLEYMMVTDNEYSEVDEEEDEDTEDDSEESSDDEQ